MQHERRRHPRLEIPLETVLRPAGGTEDVSATMQDLSAGGAGLLTTFEIPAGTSIDRLQFELPGGEAGAAVPIEVAARVARCLPQAGLGNEAEFLIGVQFVDITRELFDRIQRFVFQNLRASQKDRVQIERPIAIRFDRFDDFVDEVSVNLSHSGMFIRTRDPRPPGSVFNFQFQLGEDFSLIEGRAEVVWRRRQSEGPDKLPGMGVKFLNLDVPSQRLIDRLITQKQQAEESGAGAAAEPAAPPAAALPAPPAEAPEGAPRDAPEEARPRRPEARAAAPGPKPPPDLRQAEASIVSLGQVNALRQAAEHLRDELDEARQQHQNEMQALRARLEDRQAAASSQLEERLRDAEAARRESERQRAEVSEQLEASRQEAAELRRWATELDERLEMSAGEVADMRQRLAESAREAERLAGERAELQTQLEDRTAEDEAQRLGTERDGLQATHDRLLAELDRANGEADEMRRRLADQAAAREMERQRLSGELGELQTAHDDLQRAQDELRAAHTALRTSHDELETARDALRTELEEARAETAEARQQLDERGGDAAGLRDQLERARGEIEELRQSQEAALLRLQEEHSTALERTADETRKQIDARLDELEAERQRVESLAAEAESATDRVRQLEAELDESRADAGSLRARLDDVEQSRQTIEAEMAQLRDEARWAAQRAEEREAALREEAESAVMALSGGAPPPTAERRGAGRALRIAALLLVGAVLGTLAVGFFEPLGSLAARLRPTAETTRRAAVPAPPGPAEPAPDTAAASPASTPAAGAPAGQPAALEAAAAEPEPAVAEPEPTPGEPAPDPATAEEAVRAWAAAWSDQRVDDYLASYADTYQPPDGQSRDSWAATRRERIARPRSIQVGVDAARTVQLADDRVSVSFDQSYTSDTYADKVRKTLVLVWRDGAWRIAEERVDE